MYFQNIVNGLCAGCGYALVALGFSLIYEVCRFFDLGQGGIYIVAFYVAVSMREFAVIKFPGEILGAGVVAAGLGSLVYILVYHQLRRRGVKSVTILIASLAVLTLLQNLIILTFGPEIKTIRDNNLDASMGLLGAHFTIAQLIMVAVALGTYAIVGLVRRYTALGRTMRAIGNDAELARIVGVHTNTVTILTVAVASAIMGIAAIIKGMDVDIGPTDGLSVVLMAWVTTVIGGSGRISNTLIAGIAIGLIENLVTIWTSTSWQPIVVYTVLLVLLFIRPRGIGAIRTSTLGDR